MGDLISLFPSILATTKLGVVKSDRQKISQYIHSKRSTFKKHGKDGVLFEESPMNLHHLSVMTPLFSKVSVAVRQGLHAYGIKPDYLNFHVTRSWANYNDKGTVTTPHSHINSHLSIVYYPDDSSNNATINFLQTDPLHSWVPGIDSHPYLESGIFKQKDFNTSTVSYPPEEDVCLIFPSNIVHSVSPNPSEKPRISVAMDTLLTLKEYKRDEPLLPPVSDWRQYQL